MSSKSTVTVGLVSLGCAKNLVDTQVMCGVMLTEGVELAPNPDDADVVLINTCAFIESAREEADFEIKRAIDLKTKGAIGGIIVAGCLPQRYGESLEVKYPEVDAWLGIDHVEDVAKIAKRIARKKTEKTILKVTSPSIGIFEPRIPSLKITNGPYAYLKVADGCNHACAYCAIPGIRGHLRSRNVDDILLEAEELMYHAGVRELDIVAQDVTAYGRDRRTGKRLPDLLKALDEFDGDYWTRILYGYPSLVDDSLLESFATLRHLCHYIDIPIQHSHPDILRAMRRADTVGKVENLPARLRSACPDIAIRTTCLVGFPGETEDHFRHLCDFVREAKFDALGVFAFSCEEGTAAAALPGQVDPAVAEERRDRLMRIQKRIAGNAGRKRIGKITRTLLTRPLANGLWEARNEWQAPDVDGVTLVSNCPKNVKPGELIDTELTSTTRSYDFLAKFHYCNNRR